MPHSAAIASPRPQVDEPALWVRWRTHADPDARQHLFEQHLPWARLVARDVYRRVRLRQLEWSDYVHYATIGLLESVDRYDPSRGVDFRTYSRRRVRGAVFDGVRESGPRPGSGASLDARLDARRDALLESADDGADALEEVARVTIGLALGFLLEDGALEEAVGGDGCAAYRAVELSQSLELLRALFDALPERERSILELHYYQQVPFKDIAEHMGLTKGRISQLHRRGIEGLREAWGAVVRGGAPVSVPGRRRAP